MPRRLFDKAFKKAAVKLIIKEGFSVKEVSYQLDILPNSLYRWLQEYEKYEKNGFACKESVLFDAQYEIKSLSKKIAI